jgi:putative hemolysin
MKKMLIVAIIIILTGAGIFCLCRKFTAKSPVVEKTTKGVINSTTFSCADNKTIQALFFKDKVELTLSDGRNMLLAQAISASGARYANTDESFVFWNKGDTAFIQEGDETTFKDCLIAINDINNQPANDNNSLGLANPASVNCLDQGGQSVIQEGPLGQYGLCYFEDNRACEEWALLRGECPVGGMKTTGYDTEAQKYCAWVGGSTFAVPNATCTFKDGSTCSVDALYSGQCQKGQNK